MSADGPKGPAGDAPARVAYATCEPRQPMWDDDLLSAEVLAGRGVEVEFLAWDDPEADWASFDRVVNRSTWDYGARLEEYLAWVDRIGPDRLRNPPDLIRWNTDKRYLAELDGGGLPVPPTMLIAPGGAVPEFHDEVVIKPVVGAGARDTGRFSPEARPDALALLDRFAERDEIAMVQPYLSEIERHGETAVMVFGGQFAYALKKRAFLPPDRVAPADESGIAAAMSDETLVQLGQADPSEVDLALKTVAWLAQRFECLPLFARIDTLLTAQGPVLMEVEATEPSLYLGQAQGLERTGAELFADAVIEDLGDRVAARPSAG